MAKLSHEDGDECPEDDCTHSLHIRDHGRPSDCEPVGPVKEAVCAIHGIVESV